MIAALSTAAAQLGPGLLLAAAERTPNEAAVALSPLTGWLMMACACVLILLMILHRETWRRLWLRAEDPRAMGLFRIVFGLMTFANITNLWPLFTYLFTDEGIFFTDIARRVFAHRQFKGFGDGFGDDVPYGFFDLFAVIEWLKGPKYSLLFFWDSPTAFTIHLVAFYAACISMIVGFKTRVTKWLTWFLFMSIIDRNLVFWEGTENVYRAFLFYLCVSRCGAAYSVDNWLRCRRLRREKRLSEPGDPARGNGAGLAPCAAHPKGLEAVYRRIPAWPRMLAILQLGTLYCYTGTVKNGPVWTKGDAFYYALNLDHFYRFEPQAASAIFGTNLFRLSTWITHYWEACFPLVIAGLIIRFHRREKIPRLEGLPLWTARGLWVLFGLLCGTVAYVVLPVHRVRGYNTEQLQDVFLRAWLIGMVVIGAGWSLLRYRPPTVRLRGRTFTLDLDWFCRWFLGRRVWLSLGVIFHTHLIVLMNIGWFTPATLSVYVALLNGEEIADVLARLRRRLPFFASAKATAEPPVPSEDPTLPRFHRDAASVHPAAMVAALTAAATGVTLAIPAGEFAVLPDWIPRQPWRRAGYVVFAILAAAGFWSARKHGMTRLSAIDGNTGKPRIPWAYGPLGRLLTSAFVTYHIAAVAIWLLPDKDCLSTWRIKARNPFKWWLTVSKTSQGWKMFAPNPPRSNLYMRVLVTDKDGEVLDMNTDVYHPANRPLPWIFYTRQRKINRRIVGAEGGKGSWYQKWHARYVCREWARTHGGEAPAQVDLVKVWYRIPTPEWVKENGPYDPMERYAKTHRNKYVYTANCKDDINAQLPNFIRERYGLPLLPEGEFKAWEKGRKREWETRIANLEKRGRRPNRPPLMPISVGVLLFAVFWRWRGFDLDNLYDATRAERTPPGDDKPAETTG